VRNPPLRSSGSTSDPARERARSSAGLERNPPLLRAGPAA
jgi:hypothetical protein